MTLLNKGEMDRGNENPTQHLTDDWGKPEKPQSGSSVPGFEPGPPEWESRA